jgi:hypothetical protein
METPLQQHRAGTELFIGYAPAFRGLNDWRPVFRQQRVAANDVVVRRVILEHTKDRHRRILVDVAEGRTAKDAHSWMEALKSDRRVAESKHPWVDDFMRANLAIWVLSCGRERVEVARWVERIHGDLEPEKTSGLDSGLELKPDSQMDEAPGGIYLRYALVWERGEWAWWKFRAEGGTLSRARESDRIVIWPEPGRKELMVAGYAVEPGRETYWGRYPFVI